MPRSSRLGDSVGGRRSDGSQGDDEYATIDIGAHQPVCRRDRRVEKRIAGQHVMDVIDAEVGVLEQVRGLCVDLEWVLILEEIELETTAHQAIVLQTNTRVRRPSIDKDQQSGPLACKVALHPPRPPAGPATRSAPTCFVSRSEFAHERRTLTESCQVVIVAERSDSHELGH
jgi:hypothetical protein